MTDPRRESPPPAQTGSGLGKITGKRSNAKYTTRGLPPYARTIIDGGRFPGTSRDGSQHTYWLVIGPHAWDQAREFRDQGRAVTMLPPGDDPKRFRWDFLAGHDPVLLVKAGNVQGHEIRALVEAVMADGVGRVLDMGTMDRYVRGGAECRMS